MKETEKFKLGESLPLAQVLDSLPYNSDGLIPAVSQQYDTGEVLMMAWMNRDAVAETPVEGELRTILERGHRDEGFLVLVAVVERGAAHRFRNLASGIDVLILWNH